MDVEVEVIQYCWGGEVTEPFDPPPDCSLRLDPVYPYRFVFPEPSCYEAFVGRECIYALPTEIPPVVDFDATLVVYLAGYSGNLPGMVIVDSARLCRGELELAYHGASCGDLTATTMPDALVYIPRAGITSVQFVYTDDADPFDGCPF